jgi:hypothetical protein
MRRFALLFVCAICLVVFGLPGTSAAHEPGSWWSCFGGEPINGDTDAERDGNCWMHWNNAERGWHFIGSDDWPDGSRAVIRNARLAWTDGHALNAPEDSNWDNHVRWNGACIRLWVQLQSERQPGSR